MSYGISKSEIKRIPERLSFIDTDGFDIRLDVQEILEKLERFGISATHHSQTSLLEHLKGTALILKNWASSDYLCLAGLCHSIYGTESFSQSPATLENREFVRGLIGADAERLAYLFGAHKKESLWKNLDRHEGFLIQDRFKANEVSLSRRDLADLIALTLANWLEQRPRTDAKSQRLREDEFRRSEAFLPKKAYEAFEEAYSIK